MNKMTSFLLNLILGLMFAFGFAWCDPDPLQDYCVADTENKRNLFTNGELCINPRDAKASHFVTSALSKPTSTRNPFGFNATMTTVVNLPGLNTLGLAMARADLAPNGIVPPHTHPRATEVVILLKGSLLVGFVDTSNRMFTQQLRPGECFVFPKGLIHFLYNVDMSNGALAVATFNSQDPGVQTTSIATFTSKPPIPDEVLKKAFQISGQDVAKIRKALGG